MSNKTIEEKLNEGRSYRDMEFHSPIDEEG